LLLEVRDIMVAYDTALVLDEVSVSMNRGEFVSIIGANGAGKTTLLRTICGLMDWQRQLLRGMRKEISNIIIKGEVVFEGKNISKVPAAKRAEMGLILCPEGGRPYRELTVLDNLKAGAFLIKDKGRANQLLEAVYQLFPILKSRAKQVSGTLSGGERTMLAIGRALMSNPKLLLIDEPSLGLAPIVKEEVFKRIEEIYQKGATILLIEQDANRALKLSSRNYVISQGKIVYEGTSEELRGHEKIRRMYLGL
jgi:branched-chain amino acid transport system ATP-binding protein